MLSLFGSFTEFLEVPVEDATDRFVNPAFALRSRSFINRSENLIRVFAYPQSTSNGNAQHGSLRLSVEIWSSRSLWLGSAFMVMFMTTTFY
jgi:hypothetical protein